MATFPHLKADIAATPTIQEGNYTLKVFSVDERGTDIRPELMYEVVNGLISAVRSIATLDAIDSIVSIHMTGLVRDKTLQIMHITMYYYSTYKCLSVSPSDPNLRPILSMEWAQSNVSTSMELLVLS